MKNSPLKRRLDRLEAESGIGASPPLLIIVRFVKSNGQFGGEPCDAARAEAAEQVWTREPGETSPDFECRVVADVRTHRPFARFVMFF
jgi:hypothetical protein